MTLSLFTSSPSLHPQRADGGGLPQPGTQRVVPDHHLFAIAGHYILLNAQFLAAVHVIVYAGAIMVLFLYVIMMLNLNAEVEPHKSAIQKIAATVAGAY